MNQKAFKTAISLPGAMIIPDHAADKFDDINSRREAALNAYRITMSMVTEEFTNKLTQLDIEAEAFWSETIDLVGADPNESYSVSKGIRPAVIVPKGTVDELNQKALDLAEAEAIEKAGE